MKKKYAVGLILAMACASVTACGGSKASTDAAASAVSPEAVVSKEAEVQEDEAFPSEESASEESQVEEITISSTETWGDMTVGVPDGWTFRKGDVLDEEDTRYCSVKKSDFSFFDFKMESEELMKQQYDYNKKTYTNEQQDVSGKYGDIDWTGFQYGDGFGGYGFEIYSTVNGKPIRVSCAGFAFDSNEAETVLSSLSIK